MATAKDIGKLIAKLSAGYPNFTPNEYTPEVYFEDLQDIPGDLLEIAAQHCRTSPNRDQRFAPSAGEIRLAVADIKRQIQNVPTAIEAWGELLHVPTDEQYKRVTDDNVIEITPYQWSHPLVRKVAVMLGFPKFPNWEHESFERVAFLKAYEIELQAYLQKDNQTPQIAQFIDQQDPALFLAEQKIKQLTKGMEKK
jgi:hypothetical protein